MKLIIGLGNPGDKYKNTRHNLGAHILRKYLYQQHKIIPTNKSALSNHIYKTNQAVFAIPTEYMNNSGITVQKISNFYKISPLDIYVIHDDLDLPVGEYRVQFDRGPAGHNGIKSIIEHLGTQQFHRIRVGIGKPQNNIPVENYVLQPFSKDESDIINNLTPEIFKEINNIL